MSGDDEERPPGPAYPMGAPHHTGAVDTEIEAAKSVEPRLTDLQGRILTELRAHPDGLTSFELADLLGEWIYTVSPRVTELQLHGLVEDSGRRRPSPRRRNAVVWVISANPPKNARPRKRGLHPHDPETCDECAGLYEEGKNAGQRRLL